MPRWRWTGANSKRTCTSSCVAALLSSLLLPVTQAEPSRPFVALAPVPAVATCPTEPSYGNSVLVWLPRYAQPRDQVHALLSDWREHPLHAYLPCLSLRYYDDVADLTCRVQGARGRQRCALPLLPRELQQRHLVFTDAAIGSASAEQIVLATSTSVDVLAHEVGHWLGFADEYAMSPELAEPFCQGRYQHPSLNVVTTAAVEMSSDELEALWQRLPWQVQVSDWQLLGEALGEDRWRLGSPQGTAVGLFASRTCDNVAGRYSWKPVAAMTAMEYHDVNKWPKAYLKLLEDAGGLRNHNDWAK